MHAETSKLYNRRYQIITILVILIPFLIAVIVLFPFGTAVNKILLGILSAVGILVGSLNKVMKFSEKSHIHRVASDQYMTLNSEIVEQLLLPVKVRFNGVALERWCRKKFFVSKKWPRIRTRRYRNS